MQPEAGGAAAPLSAAPLSDGRSSLTVLRGHAPDVIEPLDYESILAAMLADLRGRWPEFSADVESEPAYKALQAAAYRELLLRQRVNDAARRVLPAFAAGADLDHVAALYGVSRRAGENDDALRARAVGALASASTAGPAAAYRALAVNASPDAADARAVSPSPGNVTVTVLPRAELAASSAPLALDTLPAAKGEIERVLVEAAAPRDVYIGAAAAAANPSLSASGKLLASRMTPGCPVLSMFRWESAGRRAHIRLENTPGGRAEDYFGSGGAGRGKTFVARAAAGGVELLTAADTLESAGRSYLYIVLPAGDPRLAWLDAIAAGDRLLLLFADAGAVRLTCEAKYAAMLDAVEAACSADSARPIGDRLAVEPATVSTYAVRATVKAAGPGAEAVRAAAEAAVREYVGQAYALGRRVGLDAIHAALHVPGVSRSIIASPAADIAPAATAAARCSEIRVSRAA